MPDTMARITSPNTAPTEPKKLVSVCMHSHHGITPNAARYGGTTVRMYPICGACAEGTTSQVAAYPPDGGLRLAV
ncbi:hypothetical protein GCM10027288_01950 [Bordetella tumbae]